MKKTFLLTLVAIFVISNTIFAFDYTDRTITQDEVNGGRVVIHSNENLIIPYYMMGGLFGDWFIAQSIPGGAGVYITNDYPIHNLHAISIELIQSSWNLISLPSIAGINITHYRGVSFNVCHLDITIIPAE